ncbi:MAG: cysteine--tRNA ligase [Planctomycetota bacterium]
MALRLYNTLSRSLEEFRPLSPPSVGMYNCGPTVYSEPTIGNFRAFLMADLLRRVFDRQGLEVTQVMNITDVGHMTVDDLADAQGEDKLEQRAREKGLDPWALARYYEEVFFDNLEFLGLRRAQHYPRATDHIPEMVELIKRLLEKGHAYVVEGAGIYFRVASFPEYGVLSGNTLDDLDAGARIEVDERKESPHDFALWKVDPKHLMQWPSPFGEGFPGWHIECSAMSRKYLGDSFDVHTGGEDNIFPHHECERAQSLCSTSGSFAHTWIHTRFLLVDGAKMSKSRGNFLTVSDLVERGYGGAEIRYALIATNYRQQANFTLEALEGASKAVERLRTFRERIEGISREGEAGEPRARLREVVEEAGGSFDANIENDLNLSGALGVVHENVRAFNRENLNAGEARLALAWLGACDAILGVIGGGAESAAVEELTDGERAWIAAREEARSRGDFGRADELRDLLLTHGIHVQDTPQGTRWSRQK